MPLRETVEKRLASNASLNQTDAGGKERLINAIVFDIDRLSVKNPKVGNRVWNQVEWKLPSINFTTGKTEVAVWKLKLAAVKKEVEREVYQ